MLSFALDEWLGCYYPALSVTTSVAERAEGHPIRARSPGG